MCRVPDTGIRVSSISRFPLRRCPRCLFPQAQARNQVRSVKAPDLSDAQVSGRGTHEPYPRIPLVACGECNTVLPHRLSHNARTVSSDPGDCISSSSGNIARTTPRSVSDDEEGEGAAQTYNRLVPGLAATASSDWGTMRTQQLGEFACSRCLRSRSRVWPGSFSGLRSALGPIRR